MPIPQEILNIPRPKNTVVICYGKNKDRYAVRQRVGSTYKNGKSYPVNGPTIGHLIDGKFIPKEEIKTESVSSDGVEIKDWGLFAEADKVFSPILTELSKFYDKKDSLKLYCIALLRVMYPGIKDYQLKDYYENSYLSVLYPGVGLSRNTVSKFIRDLGRKYSRIVQFMRRRVENIHIDEHLIIDGTLKTCKSRINSLSDFSRKSRIKGNRDLSILYCFSLEKMEPIACKCYPGNMLDTTAYSDFVEEFQIKSGLIVGDKAFTRKAAQNYLTENPGVSVLYPLRRNASQIKTYRMYDFDQILPEFEGITCKKVTCESKDGKVNYLYSFRDAKKAAQEESDWLRRAKKNQDYSFEKLEEKRKSFGTIVLDCDLDLKPEEVYKAYNDRWIIEIVMRYYKHALDFDNTREHSDFSVRGSEFIDFLSVICTFGLLRDFDQSGLLYKQTYENLLHILKRAKKVQVDNNEWRLNKLNPSQEEILIALELLPKPEKVKRKRGRPKGSKTRKKDETTLEVSSTSPKRKRGRPKGSKNKPKKV